MKHFSRMWHKVLITKQKVGAKLRSRNSTNTQNIKYIARKKVQGDIFKIHEGFGSRNNVRNNKLLWDSMKSKMKSNSGLSNLRKDTGIIQSDREHNKQQFYKKIYLIMRKCLNSILLINFDA